MEYLIIGVSLLCAGALLLVKQTCAELTLASHEMIELCQHVAEMYGRKLGSDNTFMCYYCHYWFTPDKLERIGKYDYCLEHGSRRKERMLKEEVGVSQPQSARNS